MPMIVCCIDDYFNQKWRDLYFIVFGKEDGEWRVSSQLLADDEDLLADERSDPPGREEMLAWLAEHLPQVKVAPLFTHTWDSGIISVPYDGTISVCLRNFPIGKHKTDSRPFLLTNSRSGNIAVADG